MSSSQPMEQRPLPSRGGMIGLILLALGLALEIWLIRTIMIAGPNPRAAMLGLAAFALFPLLCVLAYWVWGFFSLCYILDSKGLTIRWAAGKCVIPFEEILGLEQSKSTRRFRGLFWPGYRIGVGERQIKGGEWRAASIFSTAADSEQLNIITPGRVFGISPEEERAFRSEFKSLSSVAKRGGESASTEPAEPPASSYFHAPAILRSSLWKDHGHLGMFLLSLLVNVLVFVWIAWQYPDLSDELVLRRRFDPGLGQVVLGAAQPRHTVWRLPLIASAIWVLNLLLSTILHGRARLAVSILAAGVLGVQVALFCILYFQI